MSRTTRFTNGLTNVGVGNPMDIGISLDPTRVHRYFNDFDIYTAGDWTVTETDGAATQATLLAAAGADGGVLVITDAAGAGNVVELQLIQESFIGEVAKDMIVKVRFKLTDADKNDFFFGLSITDTTATVASSNCFGIRSLVGAITAEMKNATGTSSVSLGTVADATWATAAIVWDSEKREIRGYLNDVLKGRVAGSANCPILEEMAPTIATLQVDAAADAKYIDYLLCEKVRA